MKASAAVQEKPPALQERLRRRLPIVEGNLNRDNIARSRVRPVIACREFSARQGGNHGPIRSPCRTSAAHTRPTLGSFN